MEKSYIQKIIPFIDGMRIGSDEEQGESLTKFEFGQVLKVGDKIHFDTSKKDAILSWLEGVDWTQYEEMGILPMIMNYDANTMILGVMRLPLDEHGVDYNYLMIVGTAESMAGIVYIGKDMLNPETGETLKAGFHNLDANGDVTLNEQEGQPGYVPDGKLPCEIKEMYEETSWNGIIVGYKA